MARRVGVLAVAIEAEGRDATSVSDVLDTDGYDLLITVGGTGVGRTDATIMALAARGEVINHGIALQPGRTCAIGKIGSTPVLALPGAPDQALAAWWTLVLPVLRRLSGQQKARSVSLPLRRKIASGVGISDLVLLARQDETWVPLATGDLPLEIIARADAWLVVPGEVEGFAAGTPVDAYMLED
jgi:molybdopterin biosynthesis enzyme